MPFIYGCEQNDENTGKWQILRFLEGTQTSVDVCSSIFKSPLVLRDQFFVNIDWKSSSKLEGRIYLMTENRLCGPN